MEALAEFLPLLLIAAYYLLAARRRAAKQKALRERTQEAPLVQAEPRASTPFQQFMSQLEEAMAEAAGENVQPPIPPTQAAAEAVTPPPAPARPAPPQRPVEFRPASGSFDAPRPSDHERHGFGAENPLSEESFERLPSFGPRPAAPKKSYDPHRLRKPPPPAPTQNRRLGDLRRRLRSAEAAREAFVLQTIFGPRGGRGRDKR